MKNQVQNSWRLENAENRLFEDYISIEAWQVKNRLSRLAKLHISINRDLIFSFFN